MRKTLIAAALLLAALSGCGEKAEPTGGSPARQEPFTVMLDYFPNADHAGIFAAKAAGLYEKAGLDVKIQTPPDPSAPLKLLRAGKADVAISYEPELLLARDAGADTLVAVGALVQVPLTSVMALPAARVKSARDLAGKRVGTSGIPYQSAYLKTILDKAGVDPGSVKETNVGFDLVRPLITKRVDATLGAFWNIEGIQLARAHKDPHIIRIEKAGVPTYNELVLVARASDLRRRGELYRAFMQALARGHRAVQRDPQVGVDALLNADKDLKRGDTEAQVRATLPTFFPTGKNKPFGYMDPRQWRAYGDWMERNKLLTRPASPRALTNEFLPGEGL